ncbi:PP2C family protein-serine/threonine phosphatase [Streptomyces sp. WMMB 322]|uniref:PP2C family protein-serine/threonine phosphatase n=1 Tax=Streptomyces sp. WMMB 322 TaxID=1286821 RepID=UPI0006E3522A|nr:SpoIIE family protein phosphatase [Streptomyces sp. WMMB 322]SCK57831.1 Serine phosphatase RsbU, regulator of sigma subunit [Streptomyces sp. WMMB 322]
MPSHVDADRPAQPPERGVLDALIRQARHLRGGIDAVRPRAEEEDAEGVEDPARRWQRALCDLAAHQLDDLGEHLGRLRAGAPSPPEPDGAGPGGAAPAPGGPSALTSRVGSAEWNLLTDEVSWSEELYGIFGRGPEDGPLSLDELPSWVLPDDQPLLAAAVTDCLVDGRPIDREFRIMRPDGAVRTLHLLGEPVLDGQGGTAAMWAVLRDVSELRRSELAVREIHETVRRERHAARAEHRLAVELQETVLPPWRGSRRIPHGGPGHARDAGAGPALDIASHYLPSTTSAMIGGDWYDALELPDGAILLSAGELTGHGVAAASGMAMLLGAVRGMAFAGVGPGPLMGHLNQLLETSAQPALGSAVCCRYEPRDRTLTLSQAGHPSPVVFRGGTGRVLRPPRGVLLGAASGTAYGQSTEVLEPGDVLVLHTDGLAPREGRMNATDTQRGAPGRLLDLAGRFASAGCAQECLRTVIEEFGDRDRTDDACVLVARVTG